MGGFLPVPGQTIYGASKAAIKLMTEGLRIELRKTNVRTLCVLPGSVGTDLIKNSGFGMSKKLERLQRIIKVQTPKTAARKIINGIRRNRSRLNVGIDANAADILYRISPRLASTIIYYVMRPLLKAE